MATGTTANAVAAAGSMPVTVATTPNLPDFALDALMRKLRSEMLVSTKSTTTEQCHAPDLVPALVGVSTDYLKLQGVKTLDRNAKFKAECRGENTAEFKDFELIILNLKTGQTAKFGVMLGDLLPRSISTG